MSAAIDMGSRGRVLVASLALTMVFAGCVNPPDGASASTIGPVNPTPPVDGLPGDATTDSSFHWSPFTCQLNANLRRGQAGVEGTLVGMDGPFVLPSPGEGLPDREYWIVTVAVDRVLEGSTFEADLGELGAAVQMPPADAGAEMKLIYFTDGGAVDTLRAATDGRGRGVALLTPGFLGTAASPEFVWGLRRFGQVQDGKPVFHGDCGDVLSDQFSGLAEAVGRPADLELLSELVSELIVNRDSPETVGPLESAIPLE